MARADGEDKIVAAAVACTLGSVTVPSLASVYNEFALKKHMDTSVHEQACSGLRQAAVQSKRGGHLVISKGKFRVVYAPSWPCMRRPAPVEDFENLKYNLIVKDGMRLRLLSWLLLLFYVNSL